MKELRIIHVMSEFSTDGGVESVAATMRVAQARDDAWVLTSSVPTVTTKMASCMWFGGLLGSRHVADGASGA